ncbi:MAG: Fic family protein [Erysipelotrichaceae bacterium]|nr:Fic family protein [Erysipelotrichaceae bacterium]
MEKYVPPFRLTNLMIKYIDSIVTKVNKLDGYQSLNRMPILRKSNTIKSIHSSLAIEANSLTLEQVKDVINGKLVLGNQKEIQEVKNAYEAYSVIKTINPYSLEEIKRIHGIMMQFLAVDAGLFRKGNEGVFEGTRCVYMAPPPNMVNKLMNDLFSWLNGHKEEIHPLILSSIFHYEFVFIHPFSDGNGRMARLWQNIILSKWKDVFEYLPIESQIKKYQEEYYKAISNSHQQGESTSFIEFMLKMIDEVLEDTLNKTKEEINYLDSYVNKIYKVMEEDVLYSANQIMELLNIKSKETLRANYLDPAISNGLIKQTLPDKPTSKNQKYYKVG